LGTEAHLSLRALLYNASTVWGRALGSSYGGHADSGTEQELIQRQLERMLASKTFLNSPRVSEFLKYGVEAALAGKNSVSEYSIGIDVFGRPSNFDPRVDPIVRVHARRLRSKLAHYYQTEGINDSVEIQLPLRSYIPHFEKQRSELLRSSHPLISPRTAGAQCCIAVVKFQNLSTDKCDDYFAEGLTQEVTHSLVSGQDWRVISWTEQLRPPEIQDFARQLGVDAALCGTIRRIESRKLRIAAELISVPDRTVVWSHMYEVEIDALIHTPAKIAEAICQALNREFNHSPAMKQPVDSRAYNLYLKGRYGCKKHDRRGLTKCVDYLQKSISIAPEYAPAHAALAEALVLMALYVDVPPREAMPRARVEAQRALRADSTLADAHSALALVKAFYDRDLPGSEAEFLRAAELAPSSASILQWYAVSCLAPLGRYEEAIGYLRRAQDLDPLMLTISCHLAYAHCAAGAPDSALDQLYESLDMEPDFPLTHWCLGLAYLGKMDEKRTIEEFELAATLSSGLSYAVSSLAHAHATFGDTERASALLEKLMERRRTQYVPSMDLALVSIGLKQYDRAILHLENARADRCAWLLQANIDPRFKPLRARAEFRAIVKSPRRDH
jgi:TolB-like protein/Tfp pilus assembly protein PilF